MRCSSRICRGVWRSRRCPARCAALRGAVRPRLPGAVRRPPGAARRSAPLAGLGRLSAPHMAPRRCPVRQTPSGCAGPRHRPRAEHAGMSHATRRSAMRSQRGRARAPRLETDALNNRDRHRCAQPLPVRAPALAAMQSQCAVLLTRHGGARRGIRGTLIRKSYLFFLPEQRYPAVSTGFGLKLSTAVGGSTDCRWVAVIAGGRPNSK